LTTDNEWRWRRIRLSVLDSSLDPALVRRKRHLLRFLHVEVEAEDEYRMTTLEDELHRAMVGIYEIAKDHDYFATYFKRMLDEHGGVETARRLLADRADRRRLGDEGTAEIAVYRAG